MRVACSATISTFLTQSHHKIWVKDINLPQMNPKCMYQLLFLTDDWFFCVCVCCQGVLLSFGLFVNEVCGQHDIYRDTCARLGEPGLDRILFKILGIPPLYHKTHP